MESTERPLGADRRHIHQTQHAVLRDLVLAGNLVVVGNRDLDQIARRQDIDIGWHHAAAGRAERLVRRTALGVHQNGGFLQAFGLVIGRCAILRLIAFAVPDVFAVLDRLKRGAALRKRKKRYKRDPAGG